MQKLIFSLKKVSRSARQCLARYWHRNRWHKVIVVTVLAGLMSLGTMYGIARWYIAQNAHKPLVLGTTFIPAYAESLGLDAKKTMDALIGDVGVRHFRLVSYWDQLEPQQGAYDFTLLDWQFQKAEAARAKVTLAVGLRQPRWPECHMPEWAAKEPASRWQPRLESFMSAVIHRYKDSPALESYQLENEFFLKGFGLCTNHDRNRLVREAQLIKQLDPWHPLIISRSNNAV
ncbi:MAG: beta-galactosidase, partial [Patescibacteria group bacterium]